MESYVRVFLGRTDKSQFDKGINVWKPSYTCHILKSLFIYGISSLIIDIIAGKNKLNWVMVRSS